MGSAWSWKDPTFHPIMSFIHGAKCLFLLSVVLHMQREHVWECWARYWIKGLEVNNLGDLFEGSRRYYRIIVIVRSEPSVWKMRRCTVKNENENRGWLCCNGLWGFKSQSESIHFFRKNKETENRDRHIMIALAWTCSNSNAQITQTNRNLSW